MKLLSLRFKIVFIIVIVLMISASISIFLSASIQQLNLFEAMRNNLSVSNGILNTVIKNIMLSGEAPVASRTMSDLQALQEFEEIEIYRIDGTVAFNDYSTIDKVNSFQDRIRFEQTPRAEFKMIDNPNFQDVLESNTPKHVELLGSREMEYFFPILNLPDCRKCHGADAFIRGIAHYKVSVDEIFRQLSSARNTLTLFFLITGAVISVILIWMMQRVVVRPIFSIGGVVTSVGEGNLDVRTNVKSNDELGVLGTKLNEMISGLKEKRQLELANKEIETRNQENKKYLDNINEGLLLLNSDLSISKQYSKFLTVLFNQDNIAGSMFSDFIYPDAEIFKEEREELDQFLKMIFEKIQTEMEMILSINPLINKRISVTNSDGSKTEIIIDTRFQRIIKNGKVENVMVIFEDRTRIINAESELEAARQKSQSELEQIAVILKSGPAHFLEFVQDAESSLFETVSGLNSINNSDVFDRIFRNLHSLKGSARYMDMILLADKIHELENLVVKSRDEGFGERNIGLIRKMIQGVNDELSGIKDLTNRFSSFTESTEVTGISTMEQFFDTLKKMVQQISRELGKEAVLATHCSVEDFPFLKQMRDPVIHLLRNSIDHGIEDNFERLSLGKTEQSKLMLDIGNTGDGKYTVVVSDDGHGIDFNSVKKIAKEKGLVGDEDVSNLRLAELLFSSSFSSKKNVSNISGRGVGLDAVSAAVKSLKGTISIATTTGKGTRFTIKLPAGEK